MPERSIQSIHDDAVSLGATCAHAESAFVGGDDDVALEAFVADLSDEDATALAEVLVKRLSESGEPLEADADLDEAIDGIAAWVRKNGGAHPHTACVRKFGNAAMCAKAVDIAKGTTKWRGKKKESAAADADVDVDDLTERSFTQEQRDEMAKSGAAMSDGGFPIATKGDLKNAVKAYGRAANKAAAKRHIIKRARALGAIDLLPEDWGVTESGEIELVSDLVPLVEKAVNKNGEIKLRIIAPGQGSSGYYSEEVLKRDGPKVFTTGLHMYADHPTVSEESDRPERSIKDLVGALTSDAAWEANGSAGPGLYATAKVRTDVAPLIEELAPSIGVSIRALGKAAAGEVDGKKTRVIEAIDQAKSVDFVTVPGAGGRVLDLIESARNRREDPPKEGDEMSQEELAEARKELDELKQWKADQEARAAEAKLLAEARTVIGQTLAGIALPELTRARLTDRLAGNPPTVDGALDREALVTRVKEAAKAEADYLAEIAGPARVTGMGGDLPAPPDPATAQKSLTEAFSRITGSDKLAEIAAAGR